MTTILLVRHGETTWNREKRIQGWADTSLTDRGQRQAVAVGEALADSYNISKIHSSDLNRTRETTRLVRTAVDAPITLDSGWRERNFGTCQGLSYDEFTDQHPDLSLQTNGIDAVDRRPENGETLGEMKHRVMSTWTQLIANANDNDTVLVISHGGPICLTLGTITEHSVPECYQAFRQDNCAVNEIRITGLTPEIIRQNDTELW